MNRLTVWTAVFTSLAMVSLSVAAPVTVNAGFGVGSFSGNVHYWQDNAGVDPAPPPTIAFTETPATSAAGFVDNSALAASNAGIGWMATLFSSDLSMTPADAVVKSYTPLGIINYVGSEVIGNLSATQGSATPTYLVAKQGANYYVTQIDDRVTSPSFNFNNQGATDSGGGSAAWQMIKPNSSSGYSSGGAYGLAGAPDFSAGAADISFGLGSWGASTSAATSGDRTVTVTAMSLTTDSTVVNIIGLQNGSFSSPDIAVGGWSGNAPDNWTRVKNTGTSSIHINTGETGGGRDTPTHTTAEQALMLCNRGTDTAAQAYVVQEVGQIVENVQYTFTVDAARGALMDNDLDFKIGLFADQALTTELASTSFNLLGDLADDSWTNLSVNLTGTAGTAGQAIFVGITTDYDAVDDYGDAGRAAFTNATFTAEVVPEPATMSFLTIGALALIKRRRK